QEFWKLCMPPTPLETHTPMRAVSSCSRSRPLSAMASAAAYMANWEKRSIRRTSFLSSTLVGSKFFTSAARETFWLEASYRVMGAMPHTPARAASQVSETVWPRGVTAPIPVMTTRLFSIMFNPFCGSNRHAAVHTQHLAGDIGGLVRGKEGHRPGHVLR